jgi:hypothetical protein
MALVRINLMRQDLTVRYSRYKVKNQPVYAKKPKFFRKEFKLFIYRLLTIVCFVWAIWLHLSNANKYYQIAILGCTAWTYLMFQYELHGK